ncbi:MAG: hypothetical protein KJ847_01765, partial [Firmicutes bacterium]|nr:hypothetical protein [Bacillota bacterium]
MVYEMDSREFDELYNRIESKVNTSSQTELESFFGTFRKATPVKTGGTYDRLVRRDSDKPFVQRFKIEDIPHSATAKQSRLAEQIALETRFRKRAETTGKGPDVLRELKQLQIQSTSKETKDKLDSKINEIISESQGERLAEFRTLQKSLQQS